MFKRTARKTSRKICGEQDSPKTRIGLYFPIPDAFLRLAALGIYEEYMTDISVPTTIGTITIPAKQQKTFKTTAFGEKLHNILEK